MSPLVLASVINDCINLLFLTKICKLERGVISSGILACPRASATTAGSSATIAGSSATIAGSFATIAGSSATTSASSSSASSSSSAQPAWQAALT